MIELIYEIIYYIFGQISLYTMHSLNTVVNLIEITISIPSKNVVQQSAIGKILCHDVCI